MNPSSEVETVKAPLQIQAWWCGLHKVAEEGGLPGRCCVAIWHGRLLAEALGGEVVEAIGEKPGWVRDPECVERWPEAHDGGYDPRCCRFPKSCSCMIPAVVVIGPLEEKET